MNEKKLKGQMVEDLKNAIGPEWVEDDRAIGAAYSRDFSMHTTGKYSYPDVVVLPENTQDVVNIVQIANDYNAAVVPWTTGVNVAGRAIPTFGGILIDFKRMNKILEIDKENMIVVVEPYVQAGRLQMLLKRNKVFCRVDIPGAPSSTGVLSNHFTTHGEHFHSNRYGYGGAKVIGAEIILPTGEVLRTGTLANENWGGSLVGLRGPGPDLTSLFYTGHGTLGIVTKAAIKLFPVGLNTVIINSMFTEKDFENYARCVADIYKLETCVTAGAAGPGYFCGFTGVEDVDSYMRALEIMKERIVLYVQIEGTKRQIKYQVKIIKDILKKYGGLIISTTSMDYRQWPFRPSLEREDMGTLRKVLGLGREMKVKRDLMSYVFDLSLYATIPFVAQRGGWHMKEMVHTFGVYIKMYNRWKEILKKHNYPDFKKGFWSIWLAGTPNSILCEFDFAWDRQDPIFIEMMKAIDNDVTIDYTKMGSYHPKSTHDEYKLKLGPAYGEQYSLAKIVKKEFDPNNIFQKGLMYPHS